MEQLVNAKTLILSVAGVVGGFLVSLLGGWDMALYAFVIFVSVDWITGLMVAGVWQRSKKTKNGALESRAGFKGLCRKGMLFLFVAMGYTLDKLAGSDVLRYAAIIYSIGNESISIFENAGLMGVKIPPKLRKAIEVLTEKEEK